MPYVPNFVPCDVLHENGVNVPVMKYVVLDFNENQTSHDWKGMSERGERGLEQQHWFG